MIIYTLPYCAKCDTMKRMMNEEGIPYEEVLITEDIAKKKDFMDAPVLEHNGNYIRGMAPRSKIRELYGT